MDENFECESQFDFSSDGYQVYIRIKSLEENCKKYRKS